jgi:hypothetical protein
LPNITTSNIVLIDDYVTRRDYHFLEKWYERVATGTEMVALRKRVDADDSWREYVAEYEQDMR